MKRFQWPCSGGHTLVFLSPRENIESIIYSLKSHFVCCLLRSVSGLEGELDTPRLNDRP